MVSAAGAVIEVSIAQQLSDACSTINSSGGEYTISLQEDITGSVMVNHENAVVTLVGNGHTLTQPKTVANVYKGTLNLDDGSSALTLKSDGTYGEDPGIIYVFGTTAKCNMYDKVTVTGRKSNNYFGGGATIRRGTFHMYGGTITDCEVNGGTTCFGGGVSATEGGGVFVSAMKTTETQKTLIHNATISKNTAEQGAGIEAALNWLQADIDGCSITNNIANATIN